MEVGKFENFCELHRSASKKPTCNLHSHRRQVVLTCCFLSLILISLPTFQNKVWLRNKLIMLKCCLHRQLSIGFGTERYSSYASCHNSDK